MLQRKVSCNLLLNSMIILPLLLCQINLMLFDLQSRNIFWQYCKPGMLVIHLNCQGAYEHQQYQACANFHRGPIIGGLKAAKPCENRLKAVIRSKLKCKAAAAMVRHAFWCKTYPTTRQQRTGRRQNKYPCFVDLMVLTLFH